MGGRVAVIGLDGAPWHILNSVFRRNAMPALKRLADDALRGVLESTVPPFTPPAWTTIATGVNPGKHGVFDFLKITGGLQVRIVNSTDVMYPRIHEMAAMLGVNSVCVNQPLTFPITPIRNVAVISDWLSARLDYFPGWMSNYAGKYVPYRITAETIDSEAFLEGLVDECNSRIETLRRLLENHEWGLFWVVLSETDQLLHRCYDLVVNGGRRVDEILAMVDSLIEVALEVADAVIVVSDHGFSKYRYTINVNSLLYKYGFIVKTGRRTHELVDLRLKAPIKRVRVPEWIYRFASKTLIKGVIKRIYKWMTGLDLRAEPYMYADWERSTAYLPFHSSFGVKVTDPSMIPIVYERLVSSGLFKRVWRRGELYSGPYVQRSPEIIFLPRFEDGYNLGRAYVSSKIVEEKITFDHHPDGIFIMHGAGKDGWIGRVRAVDAAPTILAQLGLPQPLNSDGRPITLSNEAGRFNYLSRWKTLRKASMLRRKLKIK